MTQKLRDRIKVACFLLGRPKAVALAAGIDDANLSKWLRGIPALSEAKVGRILRALGLPNLNPDCSRVHTWRIKSPPKGHMANLDLPEALKLYCPNGGKIAKAPWETKATARRQLSTPDGVYAITDGSFRAVLRLAPGLSLQPTHVQFPLAWRDGTEAKSVLNISDLQDLWTEGTPTIEEFDRVWNDRTAPSTMADVIAAIAEADIPYREAVRRICHKSR